MCRTTQRWCWRWWQQYPQWHPCIFHYHDDFSNLLRLLLVILRLILSSSFPSSRDKIDFMLMLRWIDIIWDVVLLWCVREVLVLYLVQSRFDWSTSCLSSFFCGWWRRCFYLEQSCALMWLVVRSLVSGGPVSRPSAERNIWDCSNRATLDGSFSAVSTPNFPTKN